MQTVEVTEEFVGAVDEVNDHFGLMLDFMASRGFTEAMPREAHHRATRKKRPELRRGRMPMIKVAKFPSEPSASNVQNIGLVPLLCFACDLEPMLNE